MEKEHMRYQDQERYVGQKGQKDLAGKTVTIVGLGGIGSTVADRLARAGVNLRLVDKERIYEEELQRLAIYDQEHVEKFKAKEAKKILERIGPHLKVKTFHEELVPTNTFLLEGDVVIDATNDPKSSMLINKHCKKQLLVSWYAGDQGLVFWKSPKHNADKHAKDAAKLGTIKAKGLYAPTVQFGAGIILSEAMKALMKKPTTKGLITYNAMALKINVKK
jgi:molybdopterin/thiamine biosynthesis adenylyltransferase